MPARKNLIAGLLRDHFAPTDPDDLMITERHFPLRVRADLQRAVDEFTSGVTVRHFSGIRNQVTLYTGSFAHLLESDPHNAAIVGPPQYAEIDIGEDQPVRCVNEGLWLLEEEGKRFAILFLADSRYCEHLGVQFQVVTVGGEMGSQITQKFFRHLEESVARARSYRGKVLSLESGVAYSGRGVGIKVHRLRRVAAGELILPQPTFELLERNVVRFVSHRSNLARLGISTRKGLLFYGPPGTGKTHTIHYLAGTLQGVSTLIITAEQVIRLQEYMTLARLLQPSMVVLEDVDLIAMERPVANSEWPQVVLNRLLNEMDGLSEEAEVLFILTTNRPEVLTEALASRPGRIDQAIEFPLPDADGRAKLIRLYAKGAGLPESLVQATAAKTEGVSPAFLKELMRRSIQFRLERGGPNNLEEVDVNDALDELLRGGGALNRKLFGMRAEQR
jgi:hypothetical protein